MIIKKIIIENFRQFYGIHTIEFSTDKEKNVTLIMGDNGTGKTTIGQAFTWCLYSEVKQLKKPDNLLSSKLQKEMYDGWNRDLAVTVVLIHNNKTYEIKRKKTYHKENGIIKDALPQLTISIDGDISYKTSDKQENLINEILPKELSEYFFLSGEKIDSMSTEIQSGKSKDFENAVNTLLNLDYYKDAIKHLKSISNDYDTLSIDNSSEYEKKLNENINTLLFKKEDKDNLVKTKNDSIAYNTEQEIDIKSKLRTMHSSKEYQEQKDYEEKKLTNLNTGVEEERNRAVAYFINKAPYFFAKDAMSSSLETLRNASSIKTDDIPEKLHADLIDWIEKGHKCICGRAFENDDDVYKVLEEWRKIVPPESLGNIITSMKSKIIDKCSRGDDLFSDIELKTKIINEKNSDIEESEEKVTSLEDKIRDSDDTSELQSRLEKYQQEDKDFYTEKDELVQEIANINLELAKAQREKNELMLKSSEGKKIIRCKEITNNLLSYFEDELSKDEEDKRNKLIAAVNDAFKNIYGNVFPISIDETYHVSAKTENGLSPGQGMSIVFSFLSGLLKIIKENDEANQDSLESYPLVLDAPFSVFDKKRIKAICEILPRVSEQVIILIKDTDGDIAKEEMNNKIGVSYKLLTVNNSEEETNIEKE